MPGDGGTAAILHLGDGESNQRRNLWLGHEFVDEETAGHVRSVVLAAGVMALMQVLTLLMAVSTGRNLQGAFVNFLLGMILPGCGYFGATKSSSQLMCCFSCTSLLFAISQALVMANVLLAVWIISENEEVLCEAVCAVIGCNNHSALCSCEIGCGEKCCGDFLEVCHNGNQLTSPLGCKSLESTVTVSTHVATVVILIISPLVIGLSVYAWHHGTKLWARLSQGDELLVQRHLAEAVE
ncbi:unnamed protein product [Durusdinium trenchii]|uniref:SMB domain-containing protein n=2 Tax=Durusdinium trenchii TaxID=1381693 RepID=A0ABP0I7H9_9DINO